jgi:putative membrane protein
LLQSLPYICEACMLMSCLSMIIGWVQIRRQHRVAHKRWMLTSIGFAAAFFILYAVKTVFVGDTTFAGPNALRVPYQVFLQMHSVLATVAAIMGIVTLRFGFKKLTAKHGKVGKWAAITWMVTTMSGLAVFSLLYVIYPSGPTVNLFQVWIGH